MLWFIGVAFAAAIAVYWFMVRPVLAQWAAFKPFYDTLNSVEATWTFRLRMSVKGLKTHLLNMAVIIATGTLTLLEWAGASGLSAFLPNIHLGTNEIAPAVYVPTITTILTSAANLVLRKYATTTPAGSPVPEMPAVVEVPTVQGAPDVHIATTGTAVDAVEPKVGA